MARRACRSPQCLALCPQCGRACRPAALGHQPVGVVAERGDVGRAALGPLLEAHEHTRLVEQRGAVHQERGREQRLAAARGAAHQRRPPRPQAAQGDMVEALDAGRRLQTARRAVSPQAASACPVLACRGTAPACRSRKRRFVDPARLGQELGLYPDGAGLPHATASTPDCSDFAMTSWAFGNACPQGCGHLAAGAASPVARVPAIA